MKRPAQSIAVLVVVATLFTTTTVLGLLLVFNYRIDRSQRQQELLFQQRLLADQLSVSLALPVWNFDHDQINKIIESAMHTEDVYAVVVRLADLKSTVQARIRDKDWASVSTNSGPPVAGLILQTRNIMAGQERVGTLELFVTPRFTQAALTRALYLMVFTIIFFDTLLVLILYVLLYRLVLRPIRKLERYAAAVSEERSDSAFSGDHSLPGELERLRVSLNRMLELLRARHEALRISEEKFVKAFHSNPIPILISRVSDGTIIEGNEALARRYETNSAAIKGKTVFEVGIWQNSDDRELVLARLGREKKIDDLERMVRLPSGETRVTLLSLQLMQIHGDDCIVAVSRDITERRNAEQALRQSEEKFSRAFLCSPAPMAFTRIEDGRFIDVNPAFAETFGLPREDLIGMTTSELKFWPTEADRMRFVERLEKENVVQNMELQFRRNDGHLVCSQFSSAIVKVGGENLLLTVFVDLTAQKQSEQLTEAQRNVFEMIASSQPLSETLEVLLRYMESRSPDMICSILLLDADRIHVRHCAGPSLPPEFIKAIDGSAIGPEAGSCGTAAHLGEPVFVSDIATDPLWKDYKALALPHGFRACWSTPILDKQRRVLGTFAIYRRTTGLPDEWHLRLIETAVHTALVCIAKQRSDDALRASEERFALAVRGSTDGLWDWNVETDEVYFAPRYRELLGYDSWAEFPPRFETFFAHLHVEDRERVKNSLMSHLNGRTPYDIEYRLCTRGGDYKWFRARGQAIWNEAGHAIRMAGSITDVTERKRAELSLRESEARFRTVVEFSPEGISVVSADTLVYINPRGVQLLGGESAGKMVGRSIYEFVPEADREITRERLREVVEQRKAVPILERTLLRLDGVPIAVEAVSVPLIFAEKSAVLILMRDITERKKAEMERMETARREQEAQLEYTRLLIASQEAERRRIAGELHDSLGQNLLLIRNRVQQALSPSDRETVQQQLGAIGGLASDAIAEVRHISRVLRPYQLDQLGLTYAMQALIDGVAKSTDIVFERKLDHVDEALSSDGATNLYRILQETLNNILKHSQARHVWIQLDRDIREVRLWIKDDGCGFLVPDNNVRTFGGLGLRNIAERVRILNGVLRLRSNSGEGTSVEIVVPIPG